MPVKEERNNQVAAMHEQGLTLSQIGRHFGIGNERVRQILLRHQREREIAERWPLCTALSVRARNALFAIFREKRSENPKVIVKYGKMKLLKRLNCGEKTVREIEEALTRLGYIEEGQEW